jgi:hypothetical protein
MISHALTIVLNELDKHLTDAYGPGPAGPQVGLGNLSEGIGGAAGTPTVPRDILCLSLVNVREEKTLKNVSAQVRDDARLRVVYENPPVFLNCVILMVATHGIYSNALLMLSRAIRFFQFRNVLTQDNVAPASIQTSAPSNVLDRLEAFRLIFDLHSPTMEEVNHLWGTLGGKQYPFVLYQLRMMELKFKAALSESGFITEVVAGFRNQADG